MSRGITQKERVLRALRSARGRGVTAVDFLAPDVIDGGSPILRVPARIEELRRDGHHIQIAGRRNDCVIYTLTAPAEPWQPIAAAPDPEPDPEPGDAITSLFDTEAIKPRPASPYDSDGGRAA